MKIKLKWFGKLTYFEMRSYLMIFFLINVVAQVCVVFMYEFHILFIIGHFICSFVMIPVLVRILSSLVQREQEFMKMIFDGKE